MMKCLNIIRNINNFNSNLDNLLLAIAIELGELKGNIFFFHMFIFPYFPIM